MRAITVKGIPDDLYERLKKRAGEERRSINSEILVCIERALNEEDIRSASVREIAAEYRAKTRRFPLKDAIIDRVKNEGRR
jgi:plasmid stability protein